VSTPYGKAGDALLTSLPQRRSAVLWQMKFSGQKFSGQTGLSLRI
jgi:hypothetical protein